jgi:hypothetical protein
MNVEVTIVVSTPPHKQDFDRLRSAASSLTKDQKSIMVQATQVSNRNAL